MQQVNKILSWLPSQSPWWLSSSSLSPSWQAQALTHKYNLTQTHTHTHTRSASAMSSSLDYCWWHTVPTSPDAHTHSSHTYTHTHSISIWQEGTDSQLIPPARWLTTKNIRRVYFSKWAIIIKIIKRAQRRRVSEWGDAREMRTV